MRPVSFTVWLDPKHDVKTVMEFITGEALGDRFLPVFRHAAPETVNHLETLDERIQATVPVGDPKAPPGPIEKTSGESTLGYLYGAYRLDSGETPLRFRLPTLLDDDNKLELVWAELDSAVTIHLALNRKWEKPYFYGTITASHGLWGNRHHWLRAMHEVCMADSKGASIVAELETAAEEMRNLEVNELALGQARDHLWKATTMMMDRFGRGDKQLAIEPKPARSFVPVDNPVSCPETPPDNPPDIHPEDWKIYAWLERLYGSDSEFTSKRAVEYWSGNPDIRTFRDVLNASKTGMKGTWPALIKILTRLPEESWILREIFDFTNDLNWPGAGVARKHLVEVAGKRALPMLEQAKSETDTETAEEIQELIDDIHDHQKGTSDS